MLSRRRKRASGGWRRGTPRFPGSLNIKTKDVGGVGVSIFILRDVSDAQRLRREREKLRREQALAEMSAVLAHEIRNPLGSLELFAGLLAGAGLSAECRVGGAGAGRTADAGCDGQ
jgi:signal transduction histidine kinase